MHDWLDLLTTWQAILGQIAVGALFVWRWAVLPVRRAFITLRKTFSQVEGLTAYQATAIRHMDDMKEVSRKVEVMSKALGPNGGSSLSDKIDETRDTVLVVASQVKEIWDLAEKPLWLADEFGQGTRMNRAFEQTFGYPLAELIGSGWLQHVANEDRARVTSEFQAAFKERRSFRSACRYITSAGVSLHVVIRGEPVVDGAVPRMIAMRGAIEIHQVKAPEAVQ